MSLIGVMPWVGVGRSYFDLYVCFGIFIIDSSFLECASN